MDQINKMPKDDNDEFVSDEHNNEDDFRELSKGKARDIRRLEEKKERKRHVLIVSIGAVFFVLLVIATIIIASKKGLLNIHDKQETGQTKQQTEQGMDSKTETKQGTDQSAEESSNREASIIADLVRQADIFELGYNQDAAINLIQSYPNYENISIMTEAIGRYEQSKGQLAAYEDVTTIPHIFFHSLIADSAKAFDGDAKQDGYNKYMVTVSEFQSIIQQMYEKGYVLVSIKDVATQITSEDGTVRFEEGVIMLPQGKKPFVLSVDDVSYYEYMDNDGFASRIVLGEGGRPTCEMILDDGTTVTGDYDVVPCLESFIEQHPDFSYQGARGILAVTGYNGVLGYRTDPNHSEQEGYVQDCENAKIVAQGLKDWGWEFASHSYGHIDMGGTSIDKIYADTIKWQETVAPIVGETDILVYPFGSDIGDWYDYKGEKYEYLKSQNFKYFCNVDSRISWLQIRDGYVRQGRRNIDGLRMYYDMIDDRVDLLSDLFDVNLVFDESRPVPVPR